MYLVFIPLFSDLNTISDLIFFIYSISFIIIISKTFILLMRKKELDIHSNYKNYLLIFGFGILFSEITVILNLLYLNHSKIYWNNLAIVASIGLVASLLYFIFSYLLSTVIKTELKNYQELSYQNNITLFIRPINYFKNFIIINLKYDPNENEKLKYNIMSNESFYTLNWEPRDTCPGFYSINVTFIKPFHFISIKNIKFLLHPYPNINELIEFFNPEEKTLKKTYNYLIFKFSQIKIKETIFVFSHNGYFEYEIKSK